jgi:ABC-type Fe3+ transport system substrate-binding protein
MRAGTYEWDVLSIEAESFPRYRENDAVLSYKWTEAFGTNPRIVHPDGNVIAVGSQVAGIAYNTNLVPVPPTSWDDCADPAYSGKKLFDVRPNPLVTNWSAWGEEKTLDYVRRVRAGTTFVRGNTQAYTMLAAGEMSIYCAGNFGPFTRFKQSAPTAPVEMAFPEGPLLGQISLEFAALKGSPNQNAAILLLGWISTEGLAYLKETGRDSFFSPSSNLAQVATRLERDVVVLDWSYWEHSADIQQRILQEWGFPRAAN